MTMNTGNSSMTEKSVTFGKITVVEFPMELGDNPGCSIGVPVQLGWTPLTSTTCSLELFDCFRDARGRRRRKKLVLSTQQRAKIVLNAGYSLDQLAEACLEADFIRESRRDCLKVQGWDRFAAMLQTTGRLPVGVVKGVLGTGGMLVSRTSYLLESTGRTVKKIVGPKQQVVRARSA
jgi:hypothetical protein